MVVEICANSFESALIAQEAGADRIELCTQLSVGGLTPSYGLLKKVVDELDIPVHVLIRPRAGGFTYTKNELDSMYRDILCCKEMGCEGVVSGVLTADFELDVAQTKRLLGAAGSMEFTFHRAIDVAREPRKALKEMLLMGVTRVLSSGQQNKAIDGISLLMEFKELVGSKLQIMPGSGINVTNAMEFKKAGFDMIHFSGLGAQPEKQLGPTVVSFDQGLEGVSQIETIQEIINLVAD